VVVNNDNQSTQYKKWQAFTLSDKNRKQVLIPPKFGNGHLVLSNEAIFHYKQTTQYDRSSQFTIIWNDPNYKIWWPISNPILSQRDMG
jgi:dTDP-4-dehydrorhamnose 3,5-epimerase